MAYGSSLIRDARVKFTSSMSTSYTAANAAGWNVDGVNVFKLGLFDLDLGGLERKGQPNPQIRNYIKNIAAPIPLNPSGQIVFKTYSGKGASSTTAPFEATLLSKALGTLVSPSAKTDAAEAASTTTQINAASHGLSANYGVLIGTRGDSQGNGEVRQIASTNAGDYTLRMALSGAPDAADAIVNAHHVCLASTLAPPSYIDLLIVLHSGRCLNFIGGCLQFELEGLSINEIPQFNYTYKYASYRWEPTATEESIDTASSPSGNVPVPARPFGGLFFGDSSATTRVAYQAGNIKFTSGIEYKPIPDPNGPNGIGGWARTNYEPVLEFDAVLGQTNEDLIGLNADFIAGTLKQIIVQSGTEAESCFALAGIGRLADEPVPVDIDGLEGAKVRLGFTSSEVDPYFYWF